MKSIYFLFVLVAEVVAVVYSSGAGDVYCSDC